MEVTLEIKGEKALSILETLKSIRGITVKKIDKSKEIQLTDLAKAYQETQLAEDGKIKLKTFDQLIDEV
ncbi:hypothetical protein EZJ43_02480 [Pedobacter changchengzhani]|uniref:Uncharacterized protein n=1 Tax=Pedobacter changchengzhani TaxID=2529274 RepID=A0A4R5MQK2_9SPHI|nr:hypothetical protein [Pedobacter changchengzhani]TDG37976.1 hypothetical protein EZJ43_02480 [Pedobacter changchengzhani]